MKGGRVKPVRPSWFKPQHMNRIPLSLYVARNNPDGARKILEAWGVPANTSDPRKLANLLSVLLKQEGDGVLMDLGNMHPDKELILAVEDIKSGASSSADGASGGCPCGCGGSCKEKKSGACGCQSSFGGPWNAQDGPNYGPYKNHMVDEFQVYGFSGPEATQRPLILFAGIAFVLGYMLVKNS